MVFLWFSLGISTSGLKTRGRQRGKDVAAPDDAIAAHVQETEGDAQAALGAGGDLWKVENPMWFLWDLMVLFNGIFNEMYDFVEWDFNGIWWFLSGIFLMLTGFMEF